MNHASLFPDDFESVAVKFDRKKAEVLPCDYSRVRTIFRDYHYKGEKIGGGILQCFGMLYGGRVVGAAVIGAPRHEAKYPGAIDIRRMACVDESPRNSESYFISRIIKWIRKNTDATCVLSYSDLTQGHSGTIYKAANFECVGETSATVYVEWNGSTYHPRSLSIERPYSHELRKAIASGDAKVKTGLPKKIWIYNLK